MSTAERIRQARTEARLSQVAFAERIGASVRTVIRWERGATAPTHRQLPLIAEATGKPAGFFVEDEVADPARSRHGDDLIEDLMLALEIVKARRRAVASGRRVNPHPMRRLSDFAPATP